MILGREGEIGTGRGIQKTALSVVRYLGRTPFPEPRVKEKLEVQSALMVG